jgi:hypothetical protein
MRRIAVIVATVLTVAMAFLLGRWSTSRSEVAAVGKLDEPMQVLQASSTGPSRIERLPDVAWLHYAGPEKESGAVGIKRSTDLKSVIGVSVFNPNKSGLWADFFSETGHVKALSFQNGGKRVHEWTFRDDGSLDSETVFNKDGQTGTKVYYRVDGTKDREEKTVLLHG